MRFYHLLLIAFLSSTFYSKAQTYAASNFTMISVVSPETYTNSYGAKYSGCWGWYQANKNKEYAIAGSASGTYWVDVTNPATPTVSAYRAGKKLNTVWREIKTYQNYCYVVTDDGGPATFQIFDMQYLPDSVHKVHDSQVLFKRGHALWVDGNKLYVSGVTYSNNTTSSMNVYSLATPSVPVLLRQLKQDIPFISYVHDMMPVNDTVFASCGNQGLYVFKFNTNNTFTQLGSLTTYSGSGFNHSSALTPNRQTLVFTDEVPVGKPIKVANVSNVANIQVLAITNQFPQTTPHNPFMVSNTLCFMSSYQDGLQLYDISSPATPTLVGYFDTYYQGGGNNNNWTGDDYDGQWGAYPYFPSKNIFALDQMNGLFMLKSHLYQNPAPNFNTPASICSGGNLTIVNTSTSSSTYTWTFSGGSPATSNATNPIVSFASAGIKTITLMAANSTTTTVLTTKTVNITNNIIAVTSSTASSCGTCSTGIASVNPSGGFSPYTFTWSPIGGNSSTAINLPPACYTVIVKSANGCSTSSSTCVGFVTGLQNSLITNSDLLVYPNPAKTNVTIEFNGAVFNYALYNNLGMLVANNKNINNKTQINLNEFSKGIYIIEIEIGKNKTRKKLIID
ncbi:MAG: choice-of-anchor B family protein [Bacteroidota bacterium]|nr:choice-of-anchor B family protein [Bacteroidota bacterium]MDP3145477.1 choice-of-anchor B family protein [Bacteroidota bacterium]MDP3556433.1 choice-of-anchor B family protein [Bacteroidota bacterium]